MSQAAQEQTIERIRKALELNRRKMTVQVARELGVSEVEVIRCLPAGHAVELDISRWEELIRRFESLGQVHVIATNGASSGTSARSANTSMSKPRRLTCTFAISNWLPCSQLRNPVTWTA
jgi:putative heme degradation protein